MKIKPTTCKTAILLLKKFDIMLDCTYPPNDLALAISFDKTYHSCVSATISDESDGIFTFQFEISTPYEPSNYEFLSTNHEVMQKYINEL